MAPRSPRCLLAAGLLTATAALAPAAAHAQFVTLEARAGLVRAAGTYADEMGTGTTLGIGLSTRYTPSLSVRLDAEAATGFDGSSGAPDVYSYMLGLESDLVPSRSRLGTPVQLTATLSGGVTQLHYDAQADPTIAPGFAQTAANRFRPAVGVGLRLTANLTRTLGVFGGASATATLLGGSNDQLSPRLGDNGGTLVTIPLVAGVRVRF